MDLAGGVEGASEVSLMNNIRNAIAFLLFLMALILFTLISLVFFWVDPIVERDEPECGGGCVGCEQ